jgi:uncharacterized protein DUF5947
VAATSPLLQVMRRPPDPAERCEVCGASIEAEHGHLVNVMSRSLLCACRGCYLLFAHEGAGGTRFRTVPRRYLPVQEFVDAHDVWEMLDLPIGLVFFFRNSATGRTSAFYPSPAGATESELPLRSWPMLLERIPLLSTLASDVEALLVRKRHDRADAFIVPIDFCYELVGRIRLAWHGFQGGDDVAREIEESFNRAAERARQMAAA